MMALLELFAIFLAAWLTADVLTGVAHWVEDRFGSVDWPILGPAIIAPNRLHHDRPLDFTRNSFWQRNGTTIVAAFAIGAVVACIAGPSLFVLCLVLSGSVANQVHFYAHRPEAMPAILQPLQKIGLLQSRAHHGGHHMPPHGKRYCVLTDWVNPLLDHIRFWARIEACLPNRWLA